MATRAIDTRARRYDPAETRQRVLEAANMLFATKGYGATGTADIAREADVSEGSIFYHFGSKRNLLADIGRMFGETMVAAMQRDDELGDLTTETIIRRAFEFSVQHREYEKYTDMDCPPGKPAGLKHHNPEAEPFYLASREVVIDWTTRQMQAAAAKHGLSGVDIPVAAALTYSLMGTAIERVVTSTDEAERAAIIEETVRYTVAANEFPNRRA